MDPINFLQQEAAKLNIALTQEMLEKFQQYQEMLLDYNTRINLTAITDPKEIMIKHFLDSLLLLKTGLIGENISIVDVGTGAGFPLVPVCIVRSNIKPCLVDSLNKRVVFLQQLTQQLKIPAKVVHIRAEEAGRDINYREQFDVATARAVAKLRELCEYCLPLVKTGGYFIALKGYEIEEELQESKKAIEIIGGKLENVLKFSIAENKRSIVVIKKISQTSSKYPRISAKIKKNPIK